MKQRPGIDRRVNEAEAHTLGGDFAASAAAALCGGLQLLRDAVGVEDRVKTDLRSGGLRAKRALPDRLVVAKNVADDGVVPVECRGDADGDGRAGWRCVLGPVVDNRAGDKLLIPGAHECVAAEVCGEALIEGTRRERVGSGGIRLGGVDDAEHDYS